MDNQKRKQEILRLFDEIIDAHQRLQMRQDQKSAFRSTPEPEKPVIVEDVDHWFAYLAARAEYIARAAVLESNVDECTTRLHDLQRGFSRLGLGQLVWYKYNDYGIGLAYQGTVNNCPGYWYLKVCAWGDEMPSL